MFSLATWHYIWRSLSLFAKFSKYVGVFFQDFEVLASQLPNFTWGWSHGLYFLLETRLSAAGLGWRAGDQSSSTRSKLLLLVNTFLRVLKTSAIENQFILEKKEIIILVLKQFNSPAEYHVTISTVWGLCLLFIFPSFTPTTQHSLSSERVSPAKSPALLIYRRANADESFHSLDISANIPPLQPFLPLFLGPSIGTLGCPCPTANSGVNAPLRVRGLTVEQMQSQSHMAILQGRRAAAEQVQYLLLGHSPFFLPIHGISTVSPWPFPALWTALGKLCYIFH